MRSTAGISPDVDCIDTLHLGRRHVIAAYLLLGDVPAIIDPGPTVTLPQIMAGLAARGMQITDLGAIVLTHIHLDHAGATGVLVRQHPGLRVYVHERGARHLTAPERLLESARRIYGPLMDVLWGEIAAVPATAISALRGGETLELGGRSLRVLDAPGHAAHHLVYHDPVSGAAWVGDLAGIRLPEQRYAQPATPPPDIDLAAWRASLDRLLDSAPDHMLLTHFGRVDAPAEHLADLWRNTEAWAAIVRDSLAAGDDDAASLARLTQYAAETYRTLPAEVAAEYQHAASLAMSWQGLARYWRKVGASA